MLTIVLLLESSMGYIPNLALQIFSKKEIHDANIHQLINE